MSKFCKFFAKYCKMMQINSLEPPTNIIRVSNHFEAKTTKCLIWSSPAWHIPLEAIEENLKF